MFLYFLTAWFFVLQRWHVEFHWRTKLWEGNVFRRFCQSVCSQREFHVTIIHDTFHHTNSHQKSALVGDSMWPLPVMHWASQYRDAPTPALAHATSSPCRVRQSCLWSPFQACDIWWPRLETCSKLFTWGPPAACDIWWPRPKTCSNLFTWGPLLCWDLIAGYWSMHGGWVGSMHPTRMFSCLPWEVEKYLRYIDWDVS